MSAYETRLRAGLGAVAEEAGDFLRGAGPLRRALLRLARELERENREDGVRFVDLEPLIELELASGLSAPHRLRDLADVQDLIRVRALGPELAERLDPSVRAGYLDLWKAVRDAPDDSR
jgi:hypothetical protein